MVDNYKNPWIFLLDEKNEAILLFPFWHYFEEIYQRLLPLASSLNLCNESDLRLMLLYNLKISLARLLKKVLVHEFHISQKANLNLNFLAFIEHLSEKDNLQSFLERYSVLNYLIKSTFENHYKYLKQLITRLEKDLPELKATLNINNYESISIKCLGDSHCLGKQVSLIRFNFTHQSAKQLIYKPRDIQLEKAFNLFLNFINHNCLSNPLKTITVYTKPGYGWVEHVAHDKIQPSQVKHYYFKYGVLLGICHLLNGRDIHFENIIACGENPAIIDLECLFVPPVNQVQNDEPNFPSIFATLLIPPIRDEEQKLYDFSGIRNQVNQPTVPQDVLKGDFHHIVYLERKVIFLEQKENVLLDDVTGKSISPFLYSQIIAEGYDHYMNWVMQNREMLLEFIYKCFNDLESRIVFRPTFRYQSLLMELTQIQYLNNTKNYYDSLLSLLDKKDDVFKSILPHEFNDLLSGDIPYFSTMTSTTDVKNSQGKIINLKTKSSGLARVMNKIKYLNDAHINEVKEQILLSLSE